MKKKVTAVSIILVLMLSLAACGKSEDLVSNRSILVDALTGTVDVTLDKETVNPVVGERLKSGQTVKIAEASDLTLLLDMDKHVYAGENTKFFLSATGEEKSTKTRIELLEGTVKSVIDNKLLEGESYEVVTPNATMGVRGTTFSVEVRRGDNGYETILTVTEGVVEVSKVKDGGKEVYSVTAGESIIISKGTVEDYKHGAGNGAENGTGSGDASNGKYRLVSIGHFIFRGTPETEEFTYDENGYLIKVETTRDYDTNSSWVEYVNDAAGRPVKEEYHKYGGEIDYTLEKEYDGAGNLIHEKKTLGSGHILQYDAVLSYDGNGRLIEKSFPEKAWTRCSGGTLGKFVYNYDTNGNLISEEYRPVTGEKGEKKVWTYDSEGRLTEYHYINPDGGDIESDIDYKYDDMGNPIEYTHVLNTGAKYVYRMEYDATGLLCMKYETYESGDYSSFTYRYELIR